MRTLTKLLLIIGLALTLSTSAGATVIISLVQVGGTYNASVGASSGDTLILDLQYSVTAGQTLTLIDPGLLFGAEVSSFNAGLVGGAGGSTETGITIVSGQTFTPITQTADIALAGTNVANGWEKQSVAGVTAGSCVDLGDGACSSLGTAFFTLSGAYGTIDISASAGLLGGTTITDGSFNDIVPLSTLGSFVVVPMPEPTTASLLGLGLVGLMLAGRRRK